MWERQKQPIREFALIRFTGTLRPMSATEVILYLTAIPMVYGLPAAVSKDSYTRESQEPKSPRFANVPAFSTISGCQVQHLYIYAIQIDAVSNASCETATARLQCMDIARGRSRQAINLGYPVWGCTVHAKPESYPSLTPLTLFVTWLVPLSCPHSDPPDHWPMLWIATHSG